MMGAQAVWSVKCDWPGCGAECSSICLPLGRALQERSVRRLLSRAQRMGWHDAGSADLCPEHVRALVSAQAYLASNLAPNLAPSPLGLRGDNNPVVNNRVVNGSEPLPIGKPQTAVSGSGARR